MYNVFIYIYVCVYKSIQICIHLSGPLKAASRGVVYAVEFSHRSGRDLTNMAKRRPNVVPIVEDARQPQRYRYSGLES